MSSHEIITPNDINDTFKLIGKDWFLITAGTIDKCNMMTAAWGGFGVMWHKNICTIFVRPNRYTKALIDENDYFTISFYGAEHKKMLNYCGTISGKDVDKVTETGLTPVETKNGAVYFEEAVLVIECKKIYYQQINNHNFLDSAIEKQYPKKDYHTMYMGEIITCLKK